MTLLPMMAMSQEYLLIKSSEGKGIKRFEMNQDVGIRYTGAEEFVVGYMTETGDSSIIVNQVEIGLDEIEAIRIYRPFFRGIGVAQRYAAGGIIGLNLVNNAISGYRPLVSEEQGIWAASLFVTSYVWDYFSRRTYEMEDGWTYEVIQLEPISPPSFESSTSE